MRVRCVSDRICVHALILDGRFVVTRVLVTSPCVLSVEPCVSIVETRFGDAVCARAGEGYMDACLVWLDLIIHATLLFPSVLIKGVLLLRAISFVSPEFCESGVL